MAIKLNKTIFIFVSMLVLASSAFAQKNSGGGEGAGDGTLDVFIPNAFTPDGNGLNDSFGVVINGPELDIFEFSILDRNGKEIFSSTDPQLRWDGTSADSDFTSGASIFIYILRVKSVEDQGPSIYRGHVVMLR
jgi:gliding motility-associated-like protein